jgi:hypothetical protein
MIDASGGSSSSLVAGKNQPNGMTDSSRAEKQPLNQQIQ